MANFYQACFCDTPCGHRHRTRQAARDCARRTLTAAREAAAGKRPKFGHPADSDFIATTEADYPIDLYVREYHACGMRVGG